MAFSGMNDVKALRAHHREQGKQARSDRLEAAKGTAESLFEDEGERTLAMKLFKDSRRTVTREQQREISIIAVSSEVSMHF